LSLAGKKPLAMLGESEKMERVEHFLLACTDQEIDAWCDHR
jgi:hypothetical protein